MSADNIKKLKEIEANFITALQENGEVGDKLFDKASEDLDNIITTRDNDILPGLIDLFMIPNLDYTGVCESLEGDIFRNYRWEQIFKVLKVKLNKLIELNIDRAVHFVGSCKIKEVKELMSTLPSSVATSFLIELKDRCREDLARQIAVLLRKDKKKWSK